MNLELLEAQREFVLNAFIKAGKTKQTPVLPPVAGEKILNLPPERVAPFIHDGVAAAVRALGAQCVSLLPAETKRRGDALEITCQGDVRYLVHPSTGALLTVRGSVTPSP